MCYGSLPISYTHVYSTYVCITHASGEQQDTTCTVQCIQVHKFTGYDYMQMHLITVIWKPQSDTPAEGRVQHKTRNSLRG